MYSLESSTCLGSIKWMSRVNENISASREDEFQCFSSEDCLKTCEKGSKGYRYWQQAQRKRERKRERVHTGPPRHRKLHAADNFTRRSRYIGVITIITSPVFFAAIFRRTLWEHCYFSFLFFALRVHGNDHLTSGRRSRTFVRTPGHRSSILFLW